MIFLFAQIGLLQILISSHQNRYGLLQMKRA